MVPARNRRIDLNNHAVKIQTLTLIRKTQFAAESDAPSGYKENTLIRRGRSPWVGTCRHSQRGGEASAEEPK